MKALAQRLTPCGVALLAFLFYYASLPPLGLKYLVFIVPALWVVLIARTRDEAPAPDDLPSRKSLFLLKWLARGEYRQYWFAAFLFGLATLFWVGYPHPMVRLGWLALAAYLAVYLPLFIFQTRVMTRIAKLPLPFAATVAYLSCEAFRNVVMGGFSFAGLSHALYDVPLLLQLAEVGGEYLVGAWIALVGTTLGYAFFVARKRPNGQRRATRIASVALLLFLANGVFGWTRINVIDELEYEMTNRSARPLRVALLQDVTQYHYPLARSVNHAVSDRYLALAAETLEKKDAPVDIIVWPEGTYYGDYDVFFDYPRSYEPLYDYFNKTKPELDERDDEHGDEEVDDENDGDENVKSAYAETIPPSDELKRDFLEFFEALDKREARKNLFLARQATRRQRRALPLLAARLQSNLLLGYATVEPMLDGTVKYYNSAIYVPNPGDESAAVALPFDRLEKFPTDAEVDDAPYAFRRYDKVDLVMFGEYVPFVKYLPKSWNITSICAKFTLSRGRGPTDVAVKTRDGKADFRLAPQICFESSIPHYVYDQVARLKAQGSDPDALVCVSNDGWFRCGAETDLHLATQVFRAIENRRSLLAATHGGFSAWIDAAGRIREKGERGKTQIVYADVMCAKSRPIGLIRAESRDVNASIIVRNAGFVVLAINLVLALGAAARRKRAIQIARTPVESNSEDANSAEL